MKKLYRRSLIEISLVILIGQFISLFKREIHIIGFGYKNDVIQVKQSNITIEKYKVEEINVDSNRVCSFYETFNYYTFSGNANLIIEIDSAGQKLLDTVLILTQKNKDPFISFQSPIETKFKRKFFVVDETDKYFIKY